MPADQRLPGFVHRIYVEWCIDPPNAVALKGEGRPPADDPIGIIAFDGRKPGMELIQY